MSGETASFGTLLRRYRLDASLSQAALGERAGLSATAIAALERGRRKLPRPTTVLMLAGALGLSTAERMALVRAATPQQSNPVANADFAPRRVPAALTSFVGRGRELLEIRALLASVRLLTLTGPAGVGKTRLALEIAQAAQDEVAFVQLAPLADGSLVLPAVAAALDVLEQPQQSLLMTLVAVMQHRSLLMVLDNCEHLLGACAELAGTLLQRCPASRLLATSREPLGIDGEVVWRVPALSLPDLEQLRDAPVPEQPEAVSLFVERARAVQPAFTLTTQNSRAVSEICVRLDGMPLAIELAAARARMLAPSQIAERLGDRFRLLAGGSRSAPTRHQSLQAAIDWSVDLLGDQERLLLERLAVFAGGWTLEAAEAVCADETIPATDVLSLLSRLVDRSLVVAEAGSTGPFRYRLLETLREYTAERLARRVDRDALLQRHRAWCVSLADGAIQDYWLRADLLGWWDRLVPEQANFRAALRYCLERRDAGPGLRLATGLWVLWAFRGPWVEGIDWIKRLMDLPEAAEHPAARADALTVAGQMAFELGDMASARGMLQEAVRLQRQLGAQRGLAMALDHAGVVASASGDFAASRAFHEEALVVDRAAGNRGYEAVSLQAWAAGACLEGDFDLARRLAEDSLAIVNAAPARGGALRVDANITLYILGRVALCSGDAALARRYFEENLAHWRRQGDARSRPAVGALVGLGCVAVLENDLPRAQELLKEALALSQRLGSGAALAYTLEGFAILAAAAGQPDQAMRLASVARRRRDALQHSMSPAEQTVLEYWLAPARRRLGDDLSAHAWAQGQAIATERAVELARALAP